MTPNVDRDEVTGRFSPKASPNQRAERFRDYITAIRSPHTAYAYIAAVRKFEDFLADSGISLKDAQPGCLDDFVVWLRKRKMSPASVRLVLAGVKNYVDWCRDHGEAEIAEFKNPKLPKLDLKVPFVLTHEQLVDYFKAVAQIREPARTALLLLPYCGLRVSEVCKIELSRITTETDKKGKRWTVILLRGKGNKFRSAPLLPQGAELLASYLKGWRAKQNKSTWLFPGKQINRKSKPLSAKTLQAHLRNMRKKLNLPEALTPHILRKTCFTYLYRRGVSIETIAKIAGHSSFETTKKFYIAPSNTDILGELGDIV